MARFTSLVPILLLIFASSFMPQMESRKLLINTGESNQSVLPLLASLVLNALPKGTVPAASAHLTTLDKEKLFARHLAGIDRILQSVPSPGGGH
ncbi:C-TERMINALLY ENCODED PEPTIDE 14 [Hibiscus trionum]|uniref:C-TERMINALLY ENCODED PEPTIDE 14 n=1 Tax=Hibiscus trionum TaxID=183268 RepID=A0A9W7MWF8_HIBTR|nr:C-TERMINALLY ENCODED PEPTIDE 14 [Hibiscus trionum]